MKTPPKPPPNKKKKPSNPFIGNDGSGGHRGQIERIIISKQSPVDMDEIALEFFNQVGGAKGFVAKLNADYKISTPGSPERIRLMDMMTKIWAIHQAKHQATDLDIISDADIEREAMVLMSKVVPVGIQMIGWIDHVCI